MSRPFDRYDTFASAMADAKARDVLEAAVPDLLASSMSAHLGGFPLGPFLEFALSPDTERAQKVLAELATVPNRAQETVEPPAHVPSPDYEDESVGHGSALVHAPTQGRRYEMFEIELTGPSHGNPFVDVEIEATFSSDGETVRAGGFYAGAGRYVIRFLPRTAGSWRFLTKSTARSLDGISGEFSIEDSAAPGPVRVVDGTSFAYETGRPYVPFGTTAYAWTQEPLQRQLQTLDALAGSPFNKLRMCVFPKDFLYNSDEPPLYPFEKNADGSWDTERFVPEYFDLLDARVSDLARLGIEADVILFHPYDDRWGFSKFGRTADERYVGYVVRRLSGFANVWWSLANEYELLTTKRPERWHELAAVIQREDPASHLLSIHNWSEIYDYGADWATHCSIQGGGKIIGDKVSEWRSRFGKPVIVDEYGYEGDLDQGWGNLTAEDVVERSWSAIMRGGYTTHGETFYREDEVIFWSKGGELVGESPRRLEFLATVIAESPTQRLSPLPSDWDVPWAGVDREYAILYFGAARPKFRNVIIPAGMRATVELIDTWNMTVDPVAGEHEGTVRVDLPARPYMAIRLKKV